MCSTGGSIDFEPEEGLEGKKFRCNDCGAIFEAVGHHPVCPSCQSENVTEV